MSNRPKKVRKLLTSSHGIAHKSFKRLRVTCESCWLLVVVRTAIGRYEYIIMCQCNDNVQRLQTVLRRGSDNSRRYYVKHVHAFTDTDLVSRALPKRFMLSLHTTCIYCEASYDFVGSKCWSSNEIKTKTADH